MSKTALFVNRHKLIIETDTSNKIQIYKQNKKSKWKLHFSREFPNNVRIQRFLFEDKGNNIIGLIGTETELEPVGFTSDTIITKQAWIMNHYFTQPACSLPLWNSICCSSFHTSW